MGNEEEIMDDGVFLYKMNILKLFDIDEEERNDVFVYNTLRYPPGSKSPTIN